MGGLCCCCGGSSADAAPFPRDISDGKPVDRGSTDRGCLFFFVLFCVGMVCEVLWAASLGVDPRRLTHGVDYSGNICGVDVPQQWVYWCGSAERSGLYPQTIMHASTVCLDACPANSLQQIPCLMPAFHNVTQMIGGALQLPSGNVMNQQTLKIVVTQSVTYQLSYPTEPYAGKFCMPARSSNSTLRDEIINGPYAWRYRAGAAFGSLRRAAPLLIGIALLTVVLGYLYLLILGYCAGLLIFGVMALSVFLLFSSGLFFLFAIFIPGDAEQTDYHHLNPIFRTYIGWEAKWSSIVIGACLVAASACLGLVMVKTYDHIDEAVGVVAAATECIQQESTLIYLPLLQSVLIVVLIIGLLIIGLPWVAALGFMDTTDISINDQAIDGLYAVFRRTMLDKLFVAYYLFGCWWIAEFFISFGQFVVSYVVCLWYFQEVKEIENGLPEEMKQGLPVKQVRVRVSGVDDHYMPRQGLITKFGGGKYLVVPVEEENNFGPDELESTDYVKQPVACAVLKGICVGFWNHMGSMALGCLLIAMCRPFRIFSECLTGFVRQQEGITDEDDDDEGGDDDGPPDVPAACGFDTWVTLCSYLGICMETIFGGYSKNTFTEVVLSAHGFTEAAESASEFLASSGGSVSYLNGACFVYEVFGGLCITLISVLAFVVAATNMDMFANPSSDWYIPNLFWGTFFATAIAAVTAFEFMQIFNHTADTLLYCFAWNRELSKQDEECYPGKYCPGGLRDMMQDYEMEPGGGIELEGEYNAADYIMRAGFEYPVRRWITSASKSASGGSSRTSGAKSMFSRWSSALSSVSSRLSRIDEAPLLGAGGESARELSLR